MWVCVIDVNPKSFFLHSAHKENSKEIFTAVIIRGVVFEDAEQCSVVFLKAFESDV